MLLQTPSIHPKNDQEAYEAAYHNAGAYLALLHGQPLGKMHRKMAAHALRHQRQYQEIPRGHGKTIAHADLLTWFIGRDPTLRCKPVGSTYDQSVKTTKYIRNVIESEVFQRTFPGVTIPSSDRSCEAFTVTFEGRKPRDPTIEANGIMGRAGGRFDILWLDDIADLQNSILKPAEREKVKEAVRTNWLPMMDYGDGRPERLRVWKTATPYHEADITADWRREHAKDGSLLRMPCIGLQSPWAKAFPEEVLAMMREAQGPIGYARAYELIPLSNAMLIFSPEWLMGNLWTSLPPVPVRTIATVDWGFGKKESSKADPDWSVCQVAHVYANGHSYGVEILRAREPMPVFKRRVAAMCERLGVTTVFAEGNGPQDGSVQELREACKCAVVGLPRSTDKHWRATEVQSYVEQGKYHLPAGSDGSVRADFLPVYEEMIGFPAASHDDCLDTAIDICKQAMTIRHGSGAAVKVAGNNPRLFGHRDPLQGNRLIR